MQTRLSEDSNRHSPQRWEGGYIVSIVASKSAQNRPKAKLASGETVTPARTGHSQVPTEQGTLIQHRPLGCEQYTAPAESPVRNAWAHTGAVTLPTVIER